MELSLAVIIILSALVACVLVLYLVFRSTGVRSAEQSCKRCAETLAERDTALSELNTAREVHRTRQEAESRRLTEIKSEYTRTQEQIDLIRDERDTARQELAALRADHEARAQELAKAQSQIDVKFKAIAADVMKDNNETFLQQAAEQFDNQRKISDSDLEKRQQAITGVVKPVSENLDKFQRRINELEEKREGAYKGLEKELELLRSEAGSLRNATNTLNASMKSSRARGMWGEHQLRRVLELSGMRKHIDFVEQLKIDSQTSDAHARHGRPDAVVHVPGGIDVVIDAKVPMESYLDANNTDDEKNQTQLLKNHAKQLIGHARSLSSKEYTSAFASSPDFTLMFVPADPILDAAMEVQPTLWDDAWKRHRVLIATPGLLLAFLRTVALAWQLQALNDNAQEIADLGKELYDRLKTYSKHVDSMGRSLRQTVDHYNKSVGSMESRVLTQARKLERLGAAPLSSEKDRIRTPTELETSPRQIKSITTD